MRYFFNNSVSPEHSQPVSDLGGKLLGFRTIGSLLAEKTLGDVVITKSVQGKFAATNCFQKFSVLCRPRSQGTHFLLLPFPAAAEGFEHLAQRLVGVQRSQGVQVTVVRGVRHLGSTMKIRYPDFARLAQPEVGEFAVHL